VVGGILEKGHQKQFVVVFGVGIGQALATVPTVAAMRKVIHIQIAIVSMWATQQRWLSASGRPQPVILKIRAFR